MTFTVYILASRKGGTLYVGITNNIARQMWEHRAGEGSAFVKKHAVTRLVYMEPQAEAIRAIAREKRLKKWPRAWKIALIEKDNPDWVDLYDSLNA